MDREEGRRATVLRSDGQIIGLALLLQSQRKGAQLTFINILAQAASGNTQRRDVGGSQCPLAFRQQIAAIFCASLFSLH